MLQQMTPLNMDEKRNISKVFLACWVLLVWRFSFLKIPTNADIKQTELIQNNIEEKIFCNGCT